MDKLATWISHCAYVDPGSFVGITITITITIWLHATPSSSRGQIHMRSDIYAMLYTFQAIWFDCLHAKTFSWLFFLAFLVFFFPFFFFLVLVFVWELSWVDSLPDEDDRHSPRPFDKLLSLFISGWQWTFIIGDLCFICWQFSFWPTNCLT